MFPLYLFTEGNGLIHELGVMSGIITSPEFNSEIPETKDNSTMQGFVTAIYEIGCLFGAVVVLFTGEAMGRRKAIISGASIMILGVIIQVTAYAGHQPLVLPLPPPSYIYGC